MYKLSSLHHRPTLVSSSATLVMTWSSKARSSVECAFSSRVAISAGRGFGAGFNKGVHRPCCLSNAQILICHKLKLFLPVNLSTFKFLPPIIVPSWIDLNQLLYKFVNARIMTIIVKDRMKNDTRFNVVSNNVLTNPRAEQLKRIYYNR